MITSATATKRNIDMRFIFDLLEFVGIATFVVAILLIINF